MSIEAGRCPKCGTTLGANGVCARCPPAPSLDAGDDKTTEIASNNPVFADNERFGPYRTLQVLGEGGMGIVYLAEQQEPFHRRVALKVIKVGMNTKEVIARFESERQALALMDHPNIARVLDAGASATGRLYFVMEYLPGIPITEYCDQHRLSNRERLELFIQVCQAVHHAHQKGVIHRDIKPSNILVEVLDGRPVPKVIDFGVAKAISQRLTEKTLFTELGMLVGTPAYMSPEQAEGTALGVDTTTDIYSLGVVLYELLIGTLPFDPAQLRRAGYAEICRVIREEEAPKLAAKLRSIGAAAADVAKRRHTDVRTLLRQVEGDLDWTTMKALEKDRTRRYASASEFAADIRRHLNDEPVTAGPPSALYRLRKFTRKHKGAVAAGLSIMAVLAVGMAVSSVLYLRAEKQRQLATARELVSYANESLAEDPERSVILAMFAVNATRGHGQAVLPAAENALHAAVLSSRVRRTLQGDIGSVGVAFSPDGTRLISTDKVWDVASGQVLFTLPNPPKIIRSMAYSPDGKRLAVGGENGAAKIWDAVTGHELTTMSCAGQRQWISEMTFSPDGQRLATAACGAKIWDVASGRELFSLTLRDWISSIAFRPDNKRLAISSEDTAKLWDPVSDRELLTFIGHRSQVNHVTFSPDAQRLATASDDGTAKVWDAASGRALLTLGGHQSGVTHVAFSSDGKRLATASHDGAAKVWDGMSGRELLTLRGPQGVVHSVAFSPDGKLLATANSMDSTRLWDVTPEHELFTLQNHPGKVWDVAFSRDGKRLVTVSEDTVKFWDAISGEELLSWRSERSSAFRVTFSPDGTRLATAPAGSQAATVWDALSGREVLTVGGDRGAVWDVAFSPDGRRLATANEDGTAQVWDADSGQELLSLGRHGQHDDMMSVAFSPDGKRLAVAGEAFFASVWDAVSGRELLALRNHSGPVLGIAFSPDGKRLVGSTGNTAQVWDAITGRELLTLIGHQNIVWGVAFSPDGKFLATASDDGTAKVWDAASGQELVSLHGHHGLVRRVAFSPDGKRLATASDDHTAQMYVLDITDLMKLARSRVTRNLTAEECQKYLHSVPCPVLP